MNSIEITNIAISVVPYVEQTKQESILYNVVKGEMEDKAYVGTISRKYRLSLSIENNAVNLVLL
jgi:hypothetical protein